MQRSYAADYFGFGLLLVAYTLVGSMNLQYTLTKTYIGSDPIDHRALPSHVFARQHFNTIPTRSHRTCASWYEALFRGCSYPESDKMT